MGIAHSFQGMIAVGLFLATVSVATAQYSGGTGEPNDPYLICTAEQMNAIGANPSDWDKHFKLTADIDLGQYTGSQFNVIGYLGDWPDFRPFCGVFDGNGHILSNFTWSSDSRNYAGLFEWVDRKWENGNQVGTSLPEIRNLTLRNCSVSARPDATAGALVGYLSRGQITGCRVEGGHISGGMVGVLAGSNAYDGGTISQCYATGAAVSKDGSAGGLVGYNSGTVINCYAMATASGCQAAGGLIAFNWGQGTVVNCYATGTVSGTWDVGGLVGGHDGAVISSYWDCETSKQPESPRGGYGKSTAEMHKAVTFVGWTPRGGAPIWTIDEGNDYPRLYWENRPGAALAGPQLRDFLSGSGTKDDPFLIQTAEQLHLVGQCAYDWDKQFKLTADISLARYTSTGFNIIGAGGMPFTGVLDGDHHVISGFHYARNEKTYVGIIGWVSGEDAVIKNVDVVRPSITLWGGMCLGGLVGCLESGTVADCSVEGIDVAVHYGSEAGGLVGSNFGGTIKDCRAAGKLHARWAVGGLIGYNGGSIQNSSATADVTATESEAGGLAGCNWNYGVITGCFSTGSVTAPSQAGGLVGWNTFSTVIRDCYTSCAVTGDQGIGGLLGENSWNSFLANCYAVGSISGSADVGGLIGTDDMQTVVVGCFWDTLASGQATSRKGTGGTTSEMKMAVTFLDAGWDFAGETDNGTEDIWWIEEGKDYPRLWWEAAEE